jgi:UrcA family protein
MKLISFRIAGVLALLAAGLIDSACATALPAIGVDRSVTVNYRDLDLAKPQSVAALYHRIQVAAARCADHARWEARRLSPPSMPIASTPPLRERPGGWISPA